jgi:hypothetical protein
MRTSQISCRAEIRRHIAGLPEGAIFRTKDVLQCGMRNAIDQTLWRMVKSNEIERLARGLFVSTRTRKLDYSDYEIAVAKTKGFGNQIVLTGQECSAELGLGPGRKFPRIAKDNKESGTIKASGTIKESGPISEPKSEARKETESHSSETLENPQIFLTTGCSTRFLQGNHYIYLRSASGTKTKLGDDNAGKAIRALWSQNAERLDNKAINRAIKNLDNHDYGIIMNQAAVIPSWLRDQLRASHLTIWRRYSARKPAAQKRIRVESYFPPSLAASATYTAPLKRAIRLPDLREKPLQIPAQDSVRNWLTDLLKDSFDCQRTH